MILFSFGVGVASPMALSEALSVNPSVAGSASGIYGCVQMAIGALCAATGGFGENPALAAGVTGYRRMCGAGRVFRCRPYETLIARTLGMRGAQSNHCAPADLNDGVESNLTRDMEDGTLRVWSKTLLIPLGEFGTVALYCVCFRFVRPGSHNVSTATVISLNGRRATADAAVLND
ncbi:hypothetical protein [Sinorhizobium mexicanum]|uniref:Multidrug effflux MFS transporter n=1 Tax=Sinorhizobium mexicanum TaxID=375549 RepID=A0A859QQJ5_9HYPH|nr:hypothetical protein [Sinorhizobium mexicanum]MBP1888140.1 hypothetical protein [Sinorhizobium mexicanum]QLL65675.1 multidrug effflux MFS transporter [Sinorhizobium mexicanum]